MNNENGAIIRLSCLTIKFRAMTMGRQNPPAIRLPAPALPGHLVRLAGHQGVSDAKARATWGKDGGRTMRTTQVAAPGIRVNRVGVRKGTQVPSTRDLVMKA